jgi:hypothetical protein
VLGFATLLILVIVFVPAANTDLESIHPVVSGLYQFGGVWGIIGAFGLLSGILALLGTWRLFQEVSAWGRPSPLSLEEQMTAVTVALSFTAEDLAANRSGRLSPTQEAAIQQMRRQSRGWNLAGLILFPIVIGGFLLVFALSPGGPSLWQGIQRDPTVGYVVAGVGCLLTLIVGYGMLATVLRMMGPNTRHVHRASGRVRLRIQGVWIYGFQTDMCQLRIGWRRFRPTGQQAQGFWNGGRYTLYYLKHSPVHVLLSAEPVTE